METPLPPSRMASEILWGRQYPSEALEKALVDSLSQPAVTPASGDFGAPRVPGRVAALGWLYLAFWLAIALASLYSAWRGFGTYDWWWFWGISGTLFLVGVLVFGHTLYLLWQRRHPMVDMPGASQLTVRALRAAVLEGDDPVAPPLLPTAEAPIAVPANSTRQTLQVLPPQRRFLLGAIRSPALTILVLSIFIPPRLISSGLNDISWQALIVYLLALALTLSNIAAAVRKSRSIIVEMGEEGVRWRQGRRRKQLPWSEVRGWCVIFLPPGVPRSFFTEIFWSNSMRSQPVNAIYALIGEHASLTWLYHARSTQTAQGSQTLAQTIHSHITLPLRDLTPACIHLFNQLQHSNGRRRSAALATQEEDSSQINQTLLLVSAALIFLLSTLVVVAGILTALSLWQFL